MSETLVRMTGCSRWTSANACGSSIASRGTGVVGNGSRDRAAAGGEDAAATEASTIAASVNAQGRAREGLDRCAVVTVRSHCDGLVLRVRERFKFNTEYWALRSPLIT